MPPRQGDGTPPTPGAGAGGAAEAASPGVCSLQGTESAGGSDRKSSRWSNLGFGSVFSFNGKLTPGFNAAVPSDHDTGANEVSCFLGAV